MNRKDEAYIAVCRSKYKENYLFEVVEELAEWKQTLANLFKFYDGMQLVNKLLFFRDGAAHVSGFGFHAFSSAYYKGLGWEEISIIDLRFGRIEVRAIKTHHSFKINKRLIAENDFFERFTLYQRNGDIPSNILLRS